MNIESRQNDPEDDSDLPYYDGGETGCGELLLDLLLYMKKQPDGSMVRVRALDPGAPLEIPAWCRLTGHELVASDHPLYKIRRPIQTN
ncbi:MAG: sulfurtransferase TusA family protein [Planctomycetota bacterium]|nr:sulfurtransferase TusA family protein [Planctomycetota bacterium]